LTAESGAARWSDLIISHWAGAAIILALIALGWAMVYGDLDAGSTFDLFQLHKSPGFIAPALTASQEANLVQDAAPTRTASIATDTPAAPAPVSPPPVSAPAPATPELEPPRRMTASQEASLDAWMIKTYLACWKPAAQPADADPYVARVRLKWKTKTIHFDPQVAAR
jgi:hypothetical protein